MHFYAQTENGIEPRHFVPMAKDPSRTRPTRLSDVKKMWDNGEVVCPSVTTILGVLDKPGLNNWKVDRHLDAAFEYREHELDIEGYRREIKRLTQDMLDQAPKAGTDFHKLMEDYFALTLDPDSDDHRFCEIVARDIFEAIGVHGNIVQTEVNFLNHGFAGQADLVAGDWVIDYKTKETADKFKPGKMAYDEHAMQLGAYRVGLGMPNARCANVFVCLETGEVDFHEHTDEALIRGYELFKHCLAIWQIKHNVEESTA